MEAKLPHIPMSRGGSPTRRTREAVGPPRSTRPSSRSFATSMDTGDKSSNLKGTDGFVASVNIGFKNSHPEHDYKANDANLQRITQFISKPSNRAKDLEELHELPEVKSFLAAITGHAGGKGAAAAAGGRAGGAGAGGGGGGGGGAKPYSEREFLELQRRASGGDRRGSVAVGRRRVDVDSTLGDRSRFGDGDGSYWDRWLTTLGVEEASGGGGAGGYRAARMPELSMFAAGVVAPRSGMKAGGAAAAGAGAAGLLAGGRAPPRVQTYAERRRKNKGRLDQAIASKLGASASAPALPGVLAAAGGGGNCGSSGAAGRAPRGRWEAEADVQFGAGAGGDGAAAGGGTDTSRLEEDAAFTSPIRGRAGPGGGRACDPRNYFGEGAKRDLFLYYKQVARQRVRYGGALGDAQLASPQLDRALRLDSSSSSSSSSSGGGDGGGRGGDGGASPPRSREASSSVSKHIMKTGRRLKDRERRSKNVGRVAPLDLLTTEKSDPILQRVLREAEQGPEEEGGGGESVRRPATGEAPPPGAFAQATARTRFLFGCVEAGLAPRANLILRKLRTKEVNLAHQGMGDELGVVLARSLEDLPLVARLNLTDNRLTDRALVPLLRAVRARNDVLELDLSQNKLDEDASHELMSYLEDKGCSLTALVLSKADVDDDECCKLMHSLAKTPYLTTLDLSHNFIGQKENMNVVDPDYTTGGEAVAESLQMPYCNLRHLDLSWNLVRLESAQALGAALAWNQRLETLNLAYNAFGAEGGEALGLALHQNTTLRELDLSHNGVGPRAAFVLAVALRHNRGLRRIALDGNPLGRLGGETLMTIPTTTDHRIEIGIKGCNFQLKQQAGADFNPRNPRGEYLLDMEKAYDHAVLLELLRLAAAEEGCRILRCAHGAGGEGGAETEVQLVRRRPEEERGGALAVRGCLEGDPEALFQRVDADGSGMIDTEELTGMFHSLGLRGSDEEIRRIMGYYDADGSGTIDFDEFQDICRFLEQEVREMRRDARFLAPRGGAEPWAAPTAGRVTLSVDFKVMHTDDYDAFTPAHHANVLKMAQAADDRGTLLEMAMGHVKLQTSEGDKLYKELLREYGSKDKAMAAVLPSMAAPRYARLLLSSNLTRPADRRLLRQKMGRALDPILGVITGRYHLDLSKPMDRLCFQKVVGVDNREAREAEASGRHDTGQMGGFHNFRNVRYNGAPVAALDAAWAAEPPDKGHLEFDYVETTRPPPGTKPMSHTRFIGVLRELEILDEHQAALLQGMGSVEQVTALPGVRTFPRDRRFYVHLARCYRDPLPHPERDPPAKCVYLPAEMRRASLAGDVGRRLSVAAMNVKILGKLGGGSADASPAASPGPRSREGSLSGRRAGSSSRGRRRMSRAAPGADKLEENKERPLHPDSLEALASRTAAAGGAGRGDLLVDARVALVDRYVTAEQVRFLLLKYPRVSDLADLAVSCFPRVLDLRRFHRALEVLPPKTQAEVVSRLGVLNTWTPMDPDGYVEVDVGRREERQVARVLVHLAQAEPGENFENEVFQWTRLEPVVPGWALPVTWCKEDTMPHRGILSVEYYSGEGQRLRGCNPDWRLRAALAAAVCLPEVEPGRPEAFPHPRAARDYLAKSLAQCNLTLDYSKGVAQASSMPSKGSNASDSQQEEEESDDDV